MSLSANQMQFYNQMYPLAQQASAATGVDADIIFAQAALETAWGQNVVGNNYFGIKGNDIIATTKEYINGKWQTIKDGFKGFGSMADSVNGYIDFINGNSRYRNLKVAENEWAQLNALQSSGYATDPNYTDKLKSIISQLPTNTNLSGSVVDGIGSTIGGVADAVTNPIGALFSSGIVARITYVVIGVILIGLAIAAFVFLSDNKPKIAVDV